MRLKPGTWRPVLQVGIEQAQVVHKEHALVPVGALCLLVGRQGVHAAVQTIQIPGLAVADVLVQLLGCLLYTSRR